MVVKYWERGQVHDFKRIDREKTIVIDRPFWSGNLLYGYVDRFSVVAICKEDIISMN